MSVLTWLLVSGFAFGVPAQDEDAPTPRERDRGGVREGGQEDTKTEAERKKEEEERKRQEEEWKKAEEKLKQDAGKACAAGGAMCAVFVIIGLAGFAFTIFLLVWTYKDAKARGDSNAVIWILLVFVIGPIGFIIYLLARPKGEMGVCRNCHNKMMVTLTKCPHCGAGA